MEPRTTHGLSYEVTMSFLGSVVPPTCLGVHSYCRLKWESLWTSYGGKEQAVALDSSLKIPRVQ